MVGCSETTENDSTGRDRATPLDRPNEYSSEVDGISVSWPEGWHRAEEALGRPTNTVEVLALATFEGTTAGQCAPTPDAAIAAMEENDVVFTLRTSDGPGESYPPRPPELMPAAEPVPDSTAPGQSGGCYPEGVEAWQLTFQEHGRHFDAFVAARSPLSDDRRVELEEIWANLELAPIDTGRDSAEVGREYWHSLYTHCGINWLDFDGREWVADPELSDGRGNPPPEWGNPTQPGTIVLEDEDTAVFTSRDGELSAEFRPRTPQDPPRQICL